MEAFQEHKVLYNPKYTFAKAGGSQKRGRVLLRDLEFQAANFTYKLGMPIEEIFDFYCLLLSV